MRILVTGGASGLGAAITHRLAQDASNFVYFTYSSSASAAALIEQKYSNVKGIHCDFRDPESLNRLLEFIPTADIEVLVNNAYGAINKEHFYKTAVSEFASSFMDNVIPSIAITQACVKVFRKKKFGKIINVLSSYVVNKPPTGLSGYVANKAFMLSMSKSWAGELVRFGITSNSVSPSFMLTPLTADTDERVVEQMVADHPLKKLLTTAEVADAVAFLLAAPQHINGTNLVMNAGSDV